MPQSPVAEPVAGISRRSGKRRRSEAEPEATTDAKRRREEVGAVEPGPTRMREEDMAMRTNDAHDHRDKKRRKKKKRKVSIVQQPFATENNDQSAPNPNTGPSEPGPSTSPKTNDARTKKKHKNGIISRPPRSGSSTATSTRGDSEGPAVASLRARGSAEPTISTSNKGKDRARSRSIATPPPVASIPSAAQAELDTHRALLSATLPSLTCQICLLLMHRPFALAPCGHVSCYSCLVSWFTNPPPGQAPAQAQAQAPNEVPIVHHQPDQPAQNADNVGPNQVYIVPIPVAPPPVARRKKTCPHCRALVSERPVEVWMIKDMVGAVVRSGLADPDTIPAELTNGGGSGSTTPAAADPWKGIFHDPHGAGDAWEAVMFRENMGIFDEADGGIYRCVDCTHEIWDGLCVDCGRVYPGHRLLQGVGADDDDGNGSMDDGSSAGDDSEDDVGALLPLPYNWVPPHYIDVDDEGPSDEDDGNPRFALYEAPFAIRRAADESGSESEGYESSFIDDGGEEGEEGGRGADQHAEDAHEDDEKDDGSAHGGSDDQGNPPRAALRSARHTVVLSDDDLEVDDEGPDDVRPMTRGRAGRRRIQSEELSGGEADEDASGSESGLAEAVANYERRIYGDDGSLPSRDHRLRTLDNGDEDPGGSEGFDIEMYDFPQLDNGDEDSDRSEGDVIELYDFDQRRTPDHADEGSGGSDLEFYDFPPL